MSIFSKIYPPRDMEKIHSQEIKEKGISGWSVFSSGKKTADLFDLSDHSVVLNGYNTNPYVYSVVNRLALLMSSIPIKVQKVVNEKSHYKYKSLPPEERLSVKSEKLKEEAFEDAPDHRLQQLLDRPNKQDGAGEFRYNYFINKLTTGNAFIEAIKPTESRPPTEIWNLPPLSVSLNESNNFYDKILELYFNWGTTSKTIPKELFMHSKYYNPDGSVWGLSPLSAARRAVKMINDGEDWNVALIQNGAKPDFVIIVPQGTKPEQREKLKKDWMDRYSGTDNIGKEPIIMEEDFMKFEALGYSVKDMDWANSNLTSMRKVYDVYGVSSESFNDPETKTMSNKKEAIRALYTDRVLPEYESFVDELIRWLVPMYGDENITLTMDLSGVDALNEEKDKVAERMSKIWQLPPNRKLQEMGFDRIDNPVFDEPWIPMNVMPLSEFMMEPNTPNNPEEEAKALLQEYSRNGKN